jgi:DNA-binding CsgD family transcriptional regulator
MLVVPENLIRDMEAMIDGIAFDSATWSEVVGALAQALPGSFTAIQNANFALSQLNSFHSCNIEEKFTLAYRDHFAGLNPWEPFWHRAPAGFVAASEDIQPSRIFRHTEFYNDWLIPQNNVEAAAGLKIAADDGETIRLLAHYPLDPSGGYDHAATALMRRLRGGLSRTMQHLRSLRTAAERAAGHAALVARGTRPSMVLGVDCVVEDANAAAETLFGQGEVVRVVQRRLALPGAAAQTMLARTVRALCRGEPVETAQIPFNTPKGRWIASLATIGSGAAFHSFSGLLPFRRKVFVSLTSLGQEQPTSPNRSMTARLFGLSPAEHTLCECLLDGTTLYDAADRLGVARETARSRLKAIFAKTGVSRQIDLIMLLTRLPGD